MTEVYGDAEGARKSLPELVLILVRRKIQILTISAVALIASVVYTLCLPPIYTASAKLLPPQKEGGGGLSALLGQAGGLAGLAASTLGGGSDLYVSILKSRSVADAVIKRLDLVRVYQQKNVEDARVVLDQNVKIQAGKDGIITVVADDENATRAATLANLFVEELGRTTVRLNLSKAGTERVFLERRLEVVKKDLEAAESDLKSFAQRNKVVQIDTQAKASIEGVARMKADLATKEVQLSVLRSTLTDQSPEVRSLETGINRLKTEIARMSGTSGGGEGIPAVGSIPSVGLEYSRKLRELKTQEAVFEQLTKQYEVAKMNEAKDSSSFQILDQAVVPLRKSKPKRTQIVISSTCMAFFLAVVLVFLQEAYGNLSDQDKAVVAKIKEYALSLK
jgi:uncharacterized protein involved in exopolysaccharide biosynthesis